VYVFPQVGVSPISYYQYPSYYGWSGGIYPSVYTTRYWYGTPAWYGSPFWYGSYYYTGPSYTTWYRRW
jgi:hypothetical protein